MKFAILLFLLTSFGTAFANQLKVPKLFFGHSWLYDRTVCPNVTIKDEVYDELTNRTAEFATKWALNGPPLFQVLFDSTGKGFERTELTATLSLCPKTGSYSYPLVLNIRPYLKSVMTPNPVFNDEDFVDLIFHELLHTWVVNNLGYSKLIEKYEAESRTTQNHLHVMAAQKFVYLKLGREEFLNYLAESYKPFPDYARAWDIVNTEGHIEFMKEMGLRH
jgi:hypothetical protein